METAQNTPPGKPLTIDVWTTTFAATAGDWEVPLIDLEALGISHDAEGFIHSKELVALPSGAEAQPYLDVENRVVYKFFDLRPNGSLGKKLTFHFDSDGFEIDTSEAVWTDILEKLAVLNDGGGLPTEIVGLATSGDYLIAKQPRAYPLKDYEKDREFAVNRMRGIRPVGGHLRVPVIVSSVNEKLWLIGDLHERNIMRDSNDLPVIIDALTGKITPRALKSLGWLQQACEDANAFRKTGSLPPDRFGNVDDDDL